MPSGDRKDLTRRGAKLWTVLVAGGMALAAACAGMHKESSTGSGQGSDQTGSTGSSGTDTGSSGGGGGASGW